MRPLFPRTLGRSAALRATSALLAALQLGLMAHDGLTRHEVCTHGQWVDSPPLIEGLRPATRSTGPELDPELPNPSGHQHCAIHGWVRSPRVARPGVGLELGSSPYRAVVAQVPDPRDSRVRVWMLAPKQSPPTAG